MFIIKFNDGHENIMMIMRTAPRIMIFKGTKNSLNDGHENLMMIMKTASRIMIFKGTRDSLNSRQHSRMHDTSIVYSAENGILKDCCLYC